ncbi:MAG TPA: hypothetical protein VFY36_04000 [Solirubrobacteraceae bacterium]|nr:hypothetical protein [Solirubrobacteraceae bacterium]
MPKKKATPAERIAGLREELRAALAEATSLIETAPDTSAEAWFGLSERLQDACWNLASATYRPSEQPEPSLHAAIGKPSTARHYRRCSIRSWSRR